MGNISAGYFWLAGFILCAFGYYMVSPYRAKNKKEKKLTEEQLKGRLIAFQYGFISTVLILIIDAALKFAHLQFYHEPLGDVAAILIGLAMFVGQCVWHDAYTSVAAGSKYFIIAYTVIVLFELVLSFRAYSEGLLVGDDNMLTLQCITPLCFIAFIIVLVFLQARMNVARGMKRALENEQKQEQHIKSAKKMTKFINPETNPGELESKDDKK